MSSKKPATPAKKAAVKAPAKTPGKPAPPAPPAKAPAKAAASKPGVGKPAPKTANPPAAPTAPATGDEAPAVVPKAGLQKVAGRDTLCQIEILKDGHFFIARTQTEGAADKEYKNTVFEDLLTEMVITLQEQMADH